MKKLSKKPAGKSKYGSSKIANVYAYEGWLDIPNEGWVQDVNERIDNAIDGTWGVITDTLGTAQNAIAHLFRDSKGGKTTATVAALGFYSAGPAGAATAAARTCRLRGSRARKRARTSAATPAASSRATASWPRQSSTEQPATRARKRDADRKEYGMTQAQRIRGIHLKWAGKFWVGVYAALRDGDLLGALGRVRWAECERAGHVDECTCATTDRRHS